MDSAKKIINNFKFPKTFNISLNMNTMGSGLLHNKALLYLVFAISFGNFILEMIAGDMYFVTVYLIIGFLTSFFNKNMMVVLLMATIFANILTYGKDSVEGFEEDANNTHQAESVKDGDSNHDIGDAIPIDIGSSKKDKKSKKHSHHKKSDADSDSDSESVNESENGDKKKKKKKVKEEAYTDREIDSMNYKDSEKLLENQKLLMKNMKDFKPFFDTLKGIAENFTEKSSSEK